MGTWGKGFQYFCDVLGLERVELVTMEDAGMRKSVN